MCKVVKVTKISLESYRALTALGFTVIFISGNVKQ